MSSREHLASIVVRSVIINSPYMIFIMMYIHLAFLNIDEYSVWGPMVISYLYLTLFLKVALVFWLFFWGLYLYKRNLVISSARTNLIVNTIVYCVIVIHSLPVISILFKH